MSDSLDSLISSAHNTLELAATQGLIDPQLPRISPNHGALTDVLDWNDRELRRLIATGKYIDDPTQHLRALTLSSELTLIRNDLLRLRLEQRDELFALVNKSLQRLRTADSVPNLLTTLPHEVVKLGYVRALYSNIDRLRWVAYSAHSANSLLESKQLVEVGSQTPFQDLRPLMEYDMVQLRQPVLFRNVRTSERVHPALIRVTQSESMVAAPVISGTSVIGFVSIDARSNSGEVEEFDREVLSLLCIGTGAILDRLRLIERLEKTPDAPSIGELLGIEECEPVQSLEHNRLGKIPISKNRIGYNGVGFDILTRRENEILELIAKGLSNRKIAEHLVITGETVNSHVKSILRKFNVSNRTGAAEILHRNRY
jgi:DNA-binding CsgD family transcriptional regulator